MFYTIGIDGQFTVTIVGNPAGTPVGGSTNTFDYPILSSITLTCMVTSSDGSTPIVTDYKWNTTTRCFTNNAHNTPTCFPTNQTTQSVTSNNLLAEDAGTITCTATISGVDYTSGPFTLRISGIQICIVYAMLCTCVKSSTCLQVGYDYVPCYCLKQCWAVTLKK